MEGADIHSAWDFRGRFLSVPLVEHEIRNGRSHQGVFVLRDIPKGVHDGGGLATARTCRHQDVTLALCDHVKDRLLLW